MLSLSPPRSKMMVCIYLHPPTLPSAHGSSEVVFSIGPPHELVDIARRVKGGPLRVRGVALRVRDRGALHIREGGPLRVWEGGCSAKIPETPVFLYNYLTPRDRTNGKEPWGTWRCALPQRCSGLHAAWLGLQTKHQSHANDAVLAPFYGFHKISWAVRTRGYCVFQNIKNVPSLTAVELQILHNLLYCRNMARLSGRFVTPVTLSKNMHSRTVASLSAGGGLF